MLKAIRTRVQNFRNIDDSGWVPIERVTALVGRNESGKTAVLKAFHDGPLLFHDVLRGVQPCGVAVCLRES